MGFRYNTFGACFPAKISGNKFIVDKLNIEFEASGHLGESDWSVALPLSPVAVVGTVKDYNDYVFTLCSHGNRIHVDKIDHGFVKVIKLKENINFNFVPVGFYVRDINTVHTVYQEKHTPNWLHVKNSTTSLYVADLPYKYMIVDTESPEFEGAVLSAVRSRESRLMLLTEGGWKSIIPTETYNNGFSVEVVDYGK